jgi:hypothetical protein
MENEIGTMLNGIGNILAHDVSYPLDGTFLYVEAGRAWVDMSIFKDLGDRLLFRDPMDGLSDALLDLWDAQQPGKRWFTMQYRIERGKFEASFTYDPLDPEVSTLDRREIILRERYGNKQVVYPPLK